MRTLLKLAFATAVAAAALAAAVGTASANRLSTSSTRFKAVWAHLEFGSTSIFGTSTLQCPVTLEGSFHSRTISKVVGALIGYVNVANVAGASCTGGSATILRETLPWHLTYEGFTGRLPTIETVRLLLLRASFRVSINGITCLTRSETAHRIVGKASLEGERVRSIEAEANELPLTGGFPCEGATGRLLASASTVTGEAGASITIRLI